MNDEPSHPKKQTRQTTTEATCTVPGCGRRGYARGLCQTHHRQRMTDGRIRPIRPYRKRSPDTVRFAGFRLTRYCAEQLSALAEIKGIAPSAAISEVLEEWSSRLKTENDR